MPSEWRLNEGWRDVVHPQRNEQKACFSSFPFFFFFFLVLILKKVCFFFCRLHLNSYKSFLWSFFSLTVFCSFSHSFSVRYIIIVFCCFCFFVFCFGGLLVAIFICYLLSRPLLCKLSPFYSVCVCACVCNFSSIFLCLTFRSTSSLLLCFPQLFFLFVCCFFPCVFVSVSLFVSYFLSQSILQQSNCTRSIGL